MVAARASPLVASFFPWGRDTNLRIIGQFHGALASTLREPTLGVGPQSPGDAADQVAPVPTAALFAKEILESFGELVDRHRFEPSHLGCNFLVHCCSPFSLHAACGPADTRLPVDSSVAAGWGLLLPCGFQVPAR